MTLAVKMLIIALFMNVCMTLVGIPLRGYDPLGQFVDVTGNSVTPKDQFSLTGNGSYIPTDPSTAMGSPTQANDGSFIDTLKLTFNVLLLILVGLFFPMYWGFALSLPLWLTLILVIQTVAGVISVILLIRGVS